MMEDILTRANIARELRRGPLASFVDDYFEWLRARAYKDSTISLYLHALARFSVWMGGRRLAIGKNAVVVFTSFQRTLQQRDTYRRANGKLAGDVSAIHLFTTFLIERGVSRPFPVKPALIVRYPLLAEFNEWMIRHKGLRDSSLKVYDTVLATLLEKLGTDPSTYTAANLRAFVMEASNSHGIERVATITTATRGFLRFLVATGRVQPGIERAILSCACWELSSLPRYIEPADLEHLIETCNALTPIGLRERAVILLLARLGLRGGDVANLRLNDIDWTNGRLAVGGKGRRLEWLPLSQAVGDAILAYLKSARPPISSERVFITVLPPFRPLTMEAVSGIAKSAIRRSGVKTPSYGSHVLRHSAATAMLRQGVSLASIGAVLRHRSPVTTAHYAKVDFGMLAELAQPWPGDSSCS